MRLLLVHQNFPGQFRQLAPHLESRDHELVAIAATNARCFEGQGTEVRAEKLSECPLALNFGMMLSSDPLPCQVGSKPSGGWLEA